MPTIKIKSFNPRAPAERDPTIAGLKPFRKFQSTRPCGARLSSVAASPLNRCFNPRAPAERDC